MNSDGAATYLAMLISNPQTTNLQYGNYTKYLDPAVPAIIQYNIWQEFKLPIIVISSAFPVLIIVVLFARRRHKKGRNLAIISIILKLSDFILDSLFVVNHSHDIPDLTTPIMIFYVAPFAMNFLIAAWVVFEETLKNSNFMDWFLDNPKITGMFTVLAVTDVEILRALDSEIAGLKIFSATFSDKAIKRMFIASTLSFAFRDLPQLIIMSKYKISIVHYSLVPFLTLITSAALVLIGVITRVYRAISYFRQSAKTAALEDGGTNSVLSSASYDNERENN
ncbi:hypothetical protein BC938DRAFT_480194 [Jimgerdemannia flammicorona]|uniref:Transmembrane protein n=1 Tax=Jimgerdemannia flammicorona TaxID=994334 RepID=A0A433QJ72_9FUNG|nr:hypothetical protein BC938DRAFT_480194 [Jimgerdemannia flammicorona]